MLIYRAPCRTSVHSGFLAKRVFIFSKSILWVRYWFHCSPSVWPTLSFSLIFVPSPKHSLTKRSQSITQGDALLGAIKYN